MYGINATNWSDDEIKKASLNYTAHELGHWLNLKHTFEEDSSRDYPKIDEKSQTKDNIMDYDVPFKTWFKIQLEKMNRKN